jgi:SAM-dependent methyltransferase
LFSDALCRILDDVVNLKRSWDKISRHYARRYEISTETVHYGPLCPGEDRLGILGDLRGKTILDLGCGCGQNVIALTRAGGRAIGVDFSPGQIAEARRLADEYGVVDTEFLVGDIAHPPIATSGAFDLILSICAIAFVSDIGSVFSEAYRLLKHAGRLILSDMHPEQYILDEVAGGVAFNHAYPFEPFRLSWRWDFKEATREGEPIKAGFEHFVRSVPHYCNALIDASFRIGRIHEPPPTPDSPHVGFTREILSEYPYIAKHLPITFVIEAHKENAP